MMTMYQNMIGGEAVAGDMGSQPVFNPATGEQIAEVALSGEAIVDQAVSAALKALPEWANTPPLKRARVMFAYKELLEANLDNVAEAISTQHGKTVEDARGEVIRGIEVVEFACGIPHLLRGDYTRNVGPQIDSYSDRQPLGVVAGITPFNFPAMVPMWMFDRLAGPQAVRHVDKVMDVAILLSITAGGMGRGRDRLRATRSYAA